MEGLVAGEAPGAAAGEVAGATAGGLGSTGSRSVGSKPSLSATVVTPQPDSVPSKMLRNEPYIQPSQRQHLFDGSIRGGT